jgi:ribosomal protein L39E
MPKKIKRRYQKKIKLSKANRRTRWAPVWVVVKKLGTGKRVHPSAVTYIKRHWRRNKLKIKPRRQRKQHLG